MPPNSLNVLDLEQPVADLEAQIESIKQLTADEGEDRSEEIAALERHRDRLLEQIFMRLTPWDKTLLARHPRRPYTLDHARLIFDDYTELHGDRLFGDDKAMVGGIATLNNRPVMFIGHQKGRDLKERQLRNFGSAKPEGYRKALRLMKLAEKFNRPIISFVDTPAADCSVGAEERGISEAIARNLMEMVRIRVPIVVVVIGEGGSGGAIGIAVGDRALMLEYSIYSVIPPEGCAAILWRDASKAPAAAAALKLTAEDALRLEVIDEIVREPLGGAHRDFEQTARNVKDALVRSLAALSKLKPDTLVSKRYDKFRAMGQYIDLSRVSDSVIG